MRVGSTQGKSNFAFEMFKMMVINYLIFQSRFMEKESCLAFTLEENMETCQKADLGPKQSMYRTLHQSSIFLVLNSNIEICLLRYFCIEIGMA